MKTGPAFNWSTQPTAQQRIDQNNARIAQLKAELQRLKGTGEAVSDMDLLDLELASNRANAYDMNGSTTALSRIDSRMTNRAKERLDLLNKQKTDALEQELKRSDLEKQIRELQIKRAEAKTQSSKDIIDAQLADLGNQLTANGGTYNPAKYEGIDVADALKAYYENTVNTANGRKFNDNVTPEMRQSIMEGLRSAGQDELANEIEAMLTTGEKNELTKKEKAKRARIKATVKMAAKTIAKLVNKKEGTLTPDESLELKKAEDIADSLARNFGDYVKLENRIPKYTAKD